MAKLLLNLRNVGDDESREVGELLDRNDIGWYRTEASPWGISHGGIWLRENADHPRAKALMATYHAERSRRVRGEREAAAREQRRHDCDDSHMHHHVCRERPSCHFGERAEPQES